MKIILAHYKYFIQGGPEKYMLKFMQLAKEHGHTVIPFSVRHNKNLPTEYSRYFVSTSDEDSAGRFDASKLSVQSAVQGAVRLFHNKEAYRQMKRLIREEKPDLLYTLIPGALSADIFKAAKEENIPIILRLSDFRLICGNNVLLRDGNICEECIHGKYACMVKHQCVKGSRALSVFRMLSLSYTRRRHTYEAVDAVIAPPKFTAEKFIESGFFPAEKIHVNPTFLDCSAIPVSTVSKDYVLCLGRFSPEKGFIYVIEALQYLKDLPVKVAVTGDKENCDPQLKETIERLGLEDKVQFVGFLQGEALEKITAEALCVAAPAIWYDNLPNVVLEAYSYGKPVIASNLGSLAEIVEDGKTGLLFEPKNPKQIADRIRKLYEDPAYCKELGRNARTKCETDFSPQAHWERFMEIYKSVTAEPMKK